MFERYTAPLRRTIFLSRYEAMERRAKEVDTSDLVLGLSREAKDASSPVASLHERRVELQALLREDTVDGPKDEMADLPLSATAKLALSYAMNEADSEGSSQIGELHMFRGVLRTNDATAAKLKEAGWTL